MNVIIGDTRILKKFFTEYLDKRLNRYLEMLENI